MIRIRTRARTIYICARLMMLLAVMATASCRSHKDVAVQPPVRKGQQPPLSASQTEARKVHIDLDNARTFMDNNTFVSARYQFRDLNGEQLAAAQKYGVEPVDDRKAAEHLVRKLEKVESGELYLVDELTHSVPYLTKSAKRLLDDMGRIYQKSLIAAGYRPHRFIVTSLLRTRDDVERLRRVNANAARNSSHTYGTSFDVSWSRFNRTSTDGNPAGNNTLAAYLGETIYYLRDHGRCVVIYEKNQHCFHITVTE